MKVLSGLVLFVLCAAHAQAQQEAKVIAEVAAGNERLVRNAPFSAEAVSESVQTLADGNRIVRNSTSKLYRNSEGRFRREISGGSSGVLGTSYGVGHGITIMDPVAGHRLMLNEDNMTARILRLGNGQNITIAGRAAAARPLTDAYRAELEARVLKDKNLSEEEKAKIRHSIAAAKTVFDANAAAGTIAVTTPLPQLATVTVNGGGTLSSLSPTKYETRKEDLGTRDFDGVQAEGTRSVTTIPAGAIGNERPIEIEYERWYSKELELVVYSKHSDPRFGEQTYRLTNIVRSEPNPSLFTMPQGYRVLSEPASVYRYQASPASPARSTATPRAAAPPRTVNVGATKP